jgi:hypothetical protein
MKKTLLVATLALLSITSFAQQTDRSKILAGGIVNFNWSEAKEKTNYNNGLATTSTTTPTNLDLAISPNIGIFLAHNFALGLKLRYEISNKYQNLNNSFNANANLSAFMRYYKKVGKIAPFGEVSYGIGKYSNSGSLIPKSNINGTVLGFGPGVAIFLTERLGIEGFLEYQYLSSKTEFNSSTINNIQNIKSRGNSLRFNIGLQAYL